MTAVAALARTPWWQRMFRPLGLDTRLLLAVVALASIGLVMVASASISYAAHTYDDAFFFFKRHLIYLGLGLVFGFAVFQLPVRVWYRYSNLIVAGSLLLLLLVLIPGIGREVNGSRRWISLGILNLQVAEVAKLAAIIYIAAYLQRHQFAIKAVWHTFLRPLMFIIAMVALLLAQPDFGSAVVILGTVMGLFLLGGVRLWVFDGLLGAAVRSLALLAESSPDRMKRLVSFLDPWSDQFNSGHQLVQSLIAFGRGEWFGVGLGNSVQKLFYLPEAHTDFVFAIWAEEFGAIGAMLVIGLFALLVASVLRIGRRAERKNQLFSAFVAYGIGLLISAQVFINVGVNVGLLPTKGLTLPFLSYGGSSLIVCLMLMAMVLRIDSETKAAAWSARRAQDV